MSAYPRDYFRSLSKNKLEFVRRLSVDEQLARCMLCKESDFLDYELPSDYMELLPFIHIFPCKYTVDVKENVDSYITMSFEYDTAFQENVWKRGEVTFYIFCHKSLIQTDYGCLRQDFMMNRVCEIMLDSRYETWIGKLEFEHMYEVTVDDDVDYVGHAITFRMVEFH